MSRMTRLPRSCWRRSCWLQGRGLQRRTRACRRRRRGRAARIAATALRLLVLGDSTAVGTGVEQMADALAGQLARRLPESVAWRAVGENGATAAEVRERHLAEAIADPADIAVVLVGWNDALQLRSAAAFAENLGALLDALRTRNPDARLVVVAPAGVRRLRRAAAAAAVRPRRARPRARPGRRARRPRARRDLRAGVRRALRRLRPIPPRRDRLRGPRRAGRGCPRLTGLVPVDLRHPPPPTSRESHVPTIVVEVMPKAELLDPAGKAVAGALSRLGKSEFSAVRIGKRFELTVDGEVTDAVLAEARALADDMLSNAVIEDVVSVTVES